MLVKRGVVALRVFVACVLPVFFWMVVSFVVPSAADEAAGYAVMGSVVAALFLLLLARPGRSAPRSDIRLPRLTAARRPPVDPAVIRASAGNPDGLREVIAGLVEGPSTEGATVADSVKRVAMVSLHTSPARPAGHRRRRRHERLCHRAVPTAGRAGHRGRHLHPRHRRSSLPTVVEAAPGVLVRHIHAGPFEGLTKDELPGQLCVFAREVLRTEAAQPLGHYDAVHSHYWLSGQVGALARDRWGVPLVHSMHTMAKVKNDALADGDTPEPVGPHHRRGAGGRGRRHADRQHRHRGQAADQPLRRRPDAGRGGAPRASTSRCSARSDRSVVRAAARAARPTRSC